MTIFYCPECNRIQCNFKTGRHKTVVRNIRGGYGRAIYYIACPYCGSIESGFMNGIKDMEYVKSIILFYYDKGNNKPKPPPTIIKTF